MDVIEKANAGLVTINGDDDDKALLNNALNLLHDSDLLKTMGANAKQLLLDVFSVQAATNRILATTRN